MRYNSFYLFTFFFLILALINCKESIQHGIYDIHKSSTSSKAMVVTAHPLATEAGIEILRMGGNAADVAVGVQLALAVVYPRAGNLGGGGFLTYRNKDGEVFTLDFREKAPSAAHRDMYLDSLGNIIPGISQKGILSVGIPGTVAGLVETHKKLGKLSWPVLFGPAIKLARSGFRITQSEAKRLNEFREIFLKYNPPSMPFISRRQWKEGDLLRQEELAATLQLIAKEGNAGFYSGENARFLLETIASKDGLITREDLSSYQPIWRTPLTISWRGYEIYTLGLPSSGGIMLSQILSMINGKLIDSLGNHHPYNVHLIVEAERRAYADRALYLGDTDFFSVPVDSITSSEYLAKRFSDFDITYASESGTIDSALYHFKKETFETTHLSIVDPEGNAASVTTTLNDNYGSKVWVPKGGYFLNNQMDDFSAKPGTPNLYGLIGASANAIAPNKRMLSSMTPTIVEKSGELFMVLGTPGGSTIITSVLQVILNHTAFKMNLSDAVQEKRFHHQWLPDVIMYEEDAFSITTIESLQTMGHELQEIKTIGLIEAISIDENGLIHGAADPRSDDHAAGL